MLETYEFIAVWCLVIVFVTFELYKQKKHQHQDE